MSKNIVIFGDSYSTYEGSIPAGYPTYYAKSGTPDHAPSKMAYRNGVDLAEQRVN